MIRSQRGSAMIVVMMGISLAILLGGVAITNTVQVLAGSNTNTNVKKAQQAADAAVDAAIFAQNRGDLLGTLKINPQAPETVLQQACVSTGVGDVLNQQALAAGETWCPEVRETIDSQSSWSYRVSQLSRLGNGVCGVNAALTLDRKIVAIGRSNGIVRRVTADLRSPVSIFSGAAVQSASSTTPLTMSGTSRIVGNAHSNASMTGSGLPVVTGVATVGATASVNGITVGTSGPACNPFVLPPIEPGNSKTTNDNALFTKTCVNWSLLLLPTITCTPPLLPVRGDVIYTAGAQPTLQITGAARAVLTGNTYSFCSIRVEGQGLLVIPAGSQPVRIFLRSPEECGGAGTGQITVDSLARIVNCHTQNDAGSLQIYAEGSASIATLQSFGGGANLAAATTAALCGANLPQVGTPMVVYAPRSTVELKSATAIAGTVAGNVVTMAGSASVTSVNSLVNLDQLGSSPVLPLYRATGYRSCTSRDFGALPNANPALDC